ncbi:WapI family immunity protein [Dyella terrae]|uniref:WapI family immunity protein n=1 Tax=Dyella terrae TaxID=522259 RepID=UPI001EFC323C|nr:hypothetical protein [Dyella terrae]ULU26768.1 hypothetical protein DYST_03716 [Dyella terrae]
MDSVLFVGDGGEQLRMDVLGYEREPAGEYFDDNWLSVAVELKAGGFTGFFSASFLTSEIEAFHGEAAKLYDSLTGQAKFRTLEEQLSLDLVGDGRGHIRLTGRAADQPGIGNTLAFSFAFDQTQLQSSVQGLAQLLKIFPVRN